MIWERSLLLKFEIIGVFVNSLTAAYKYPVPDCKNLLFPKNQKLFLRFIVPFMEFTSNFKHFQKKKFVIANVFPKLQTDKNLVRPLSKSAVSEHPSTVNIVNGP